MDENPDNGIASPGSEVYAAVVTRRTHFDNLLWQVPVLSLTGQAFLFSVALAPDTRPFSRIIACVLSLTVTGLTLQLFTRHRQGEIADAHWLEEYEIERYGRGLAHGRTWQARRNATSADAGWLSSWAHTGSFMVWSVGLTLFGLVALLILTVTLTAPQLLQH